MREIEVFLPLSFLGAQTAEGTADTFLSLFALLWSGIFLFFPLFNRDRLRVGDLVAGTWVVRTGKGGLVADLVGSARTGRGAPSPRPRSTSTASMSCRRSRTCCATRPGDAIATVARTIRAKAGMPDDGDDYGFLSDYYAALCAHLEARPDGRPQARQQVQRVTANMANGPGRVASRKHRDLALG